MRTFLTNPRGPAQSGPAAGIRHKLKKSTHRGAQPSAHLPAEPRTGKSSAPNPTGRLAVPQEPAQCPQVSGYARKKQTRPKAASNQTVSPAQAGIQGHEAADRKRARPPDKEPLLVAPGLMASPYHRIQGRPRAANPTGGQRPARLHAEVQTPQKRPRSPAPPQAKGHLPPGQQNDSP